MLLFCKSMLIAAVEPEKKGIRGWKNMRIKQSKHGEEKWRSGIVKYFQTADFTETIIWNHSQVEFYVTRVLRVQNKVKITVAPLKQN